MTQSAAPTPAADGAFQEAPKLPESFAPSGSGFVARPSGEDIAEFVELLHKLIAFAANHHCRPNTQPGPTKTYEWLKAGAP